jgi:hypothetical protein
MHMWALSSFVQCLCCMQCETCFFDHLLLYFILAWPQGGSEVGSLVH